MPACTPEELDSASRVLRKFNIPHHRNALAIPDHALQVLGAFKLALRDSMQRTMDCKSGLHAIEREAGRMGQRVVDLLQPGLSDALQDPRRFSQVLAETLTIPEGVFTVESIAHDLRNREGGFQPIDTPWVDDVVQAIQEHPTEHSFVVALNAGGTEEQFSTGDVSATGVDVREISTRPLEKQRCATWDDFWALHFNEQQLQALAALPEDTTISIGLAFPQETVRTEDRRTDAHVIHFADKYDASAIAPKNAAEAEQAGIDPRNRPSLATTLRSFLMQETGKNFRRISITPNDTITGAVAFAGSPTAKGKRIGCMVCGTGFNLSAGGVNMEAGHYVRDFPFTPFDRVALAQRGGGVLDVENAACGKILSDTFLSLVRASCKEELTRGPQGQPQKRIPKLVHDLEQLTRKDRDVLCFRLAQGDARTINANGWAEFGTPQMFQIGERLVARTSDTVARLAAAAHQVYGVEAIYGEGSYVRKEPEFVRDVNDRVRELLPDRREDLLLIEPIPMRYSDAGSKKNEAASLAGTFLYAHGENLLTR